MLAGSPIGPDSARYPVSGATHHLTADMANLSTHFKYHGPDQVYASNGTALPISHAGSSLLHTPHSFCLTNILHVPNMTKKLLFVQIVYQGW